ncbi:uncharacterized protein LOC106170705 [Lingula anatina]|uniref:Uncharacterized protein LOC106170705 n=1 Tax=Lingula anatina TaxID=7574 RepID=A0A1S3J8D7_LINAN|nr:uncharacterized protein LOC106170705 [Lingula anatina]|eukprot:XP_013406129.1 uncharacterized protein LOC106170705 [Lingula anatina]
MAERSLSTASDTQLTFDGEPEERLKKEPQQGVIGGVLDTIWRLGACAIAGILFGIFMEKGRVFEPKHIRYQMVFTNFIMLKMFLSAVATGQICLGIFYLIPQLKERFHKTMTAYTDVFATKGVLTSILGAFTLGVGMTLSGACPGMVLVQVGSWTPNSIFTLIGALTGTLLYGLFAPWIIRFSRPKKPFQKPTVHERFNIPFAALAIPMAVALGVVVFVIEWFRPWNSLLELSIPNNPDADIVTVRAWPPYISGALIGLLQIVIVLVVDDTLGGSSAYVTVVSQWVVSEKLQEKFPYLARARTGIGNWWQVVYVFGAILGGALSALSSSSYGSTQGVSVVTAFFGGFLMLIGARFAAGCTSGHGLSGMSLLAWLSFLAVPSMFAGGIVTAFSMQATGALYEFVNCTACA